jgi:uncharacterized cupin superfamily protein
VLVKDPTCSSRITTRQLGGFFERQRTPLGQRFFPPAGTGVAHAFVADAAEELEFLSIGERKDSDVITYPDSGKLLVACVADENGECKDRLGRLQEADYFDGEL